MNKIMLVAIMSVTFLAGTVLSTTLNIADATGPFCDASNVPKGKPFVDIWFFVCNLEAEIEDLQTQSDSLESQTDSLESETDSLESRVSILESSSGGGEPGPNPIVCPPVNADLATTASKPAGLPLANLQGCDLSGVNLSFADLRYANMQDVILNGAHLGGADLTGANLDGADWTGAHGTCFGHPNCLTITPEAGHG